MEELEMFVYSMTQWIVGDEPIETGLKRLKNCGYDGIEFAAEPYSLNQDVLVELLEKYGLICTSLCGIFSERRDLTAEDPEIVKETILYLKDSVDFAVKVGASHIIVVPSPVGRTSLPEGRTYESVWNCAVNNLREAADYAEEKGIRFAVEAINRFETYFINTLTKAISFVKEVNHPAVHIMADLFHMNMEENSIAASLHMVSDYLIHVHIADNTREAAGLGTIDFKEVVYTLRDIGYKGPLTMEFLPRVADPYAAMDVSANRELMDRYAKQSIDHMKYMERCIDWVR